MGPTWGPRGLQDRSKGGQIALPRGSPAQIALRPLTWTPHGPQMHPKCTPNEPQVGVMLGSSWGHLGVRWPKPLTMPMAMTSAMAVEMANGHGRGHCQLPWSWPWPLAMTMANGHTNGHDHGHGHGPWPWPMPRANAKGQSSWGHLGVVLGSSGIIRLKK